MINCLLIVAYNRCSTYYEQKNAFYALYETGDNETNFTNPNVYSFHCYNSDLTQEIPYLSKTL